MIGKKKDVFSGTEYCTVSEQLAKDVCEIVHSLGGIARLKSKIGSYTKNGVKHLCQKAYRINIKMPKEINPFRLKRKADRYNVPEKYNVARYIKDIKLEKVGEAVCIKVDAPDQLYVTEHGIVTHNTGQALIVMNMRHPVEALIICPSILKYNWLKEARKWMIGNITVYIYESKKIRYYEKRLTNHDKNTVLHIINYDILEKFKDRLMEIPFNFFVADESHYMKNQEANRTKIAQKLAKKAKWKIFITGTPIYNKPKDLYVCLNLIDPEMFGNYYMFATKYCGAKKVKIGSKSVMKLEGPTNVEELNTILRANYMVRRMKTDVMKDLPEKMKDVIILNEDDLDGLVQKEKKALADGKAQEEKMKAEVEELRELIKTNKEYETIYKDKVKTLREVRFKSFGELSRIRKELAIKKVPYVIDFVTDILENSQDPQSKIVVFGHHTEVLEAIYTSLIKYGPVIITGKVSDTERQRSIALFKEKNNTRVFIGSMGAAGTGVDGLQVNCNTVVFAELDWTPSLVDQAESRLQRIGQKNTVWVYHIVANDSIDSRIVKLMMEKEAVSKEILDFRPEELYDKLVQGK
jgi:SWI/SNF-related matrix-associated actin-dependent regulator 1 of chromatin subfamily A